jgi:hypothetical protein
MNPSSGETKPSFEMPPTPDNEGLEQQHDKQMEQSGHSESAAGKQQPAALNNAPVLALPSDLPTVAPVSLPTDDAKDDKTTPTTGQPLVNHDSHRIEKVWVDRAKKVITQTRENPHAQKHEMSLVKADYIRMRYNKTIPTDGAEKS